MDKTAQYKKALRQLTEAVQAFENAMDVEMKQPSTPERGQRIAKLLNQLTLANQGAMHFTLGYSFGQIDKMANRTVTSAAPVTATAQSGTRYEARPMYAVNVGDFEQWTPRDRRISKIELVNGSYRVWYDGQDGPMAFYEIEPEEKIDIRVAAQPQPAQRSDVAVPSEPTAYGSDERIAELEKKAAIAARAVELAELWAAAVNTAPATVPTAKAVRLSKAQRNMLTSLPRNTYEHPLRGTASTTAKSLIKLGYAQMRGMMVHQQTLTITDAGRAALS